MDKTLKLSGNKIIIPIEKPVEINETTSDEAYLPVGCLTNDGKLVVRRHASTCAADLRLKEVSLMDVTVTFKINATEYNGHERCKSGISLQRFAVELVGDMLRGLADLPNTVKVKVNSNNGTMSTEKEIKL